MDRDRERTFTTCDMSPPKRLTVVGQPTPGVLGRRIAYNIRRWSGAGNPLYERQGKGRVECEGSVRGV
jgi:hypothetical protein